VPSLAGAGSEKDATSEAVLGGGGGAEANAAVKAADSELVCLGGGRAWAVGLVLAKVPSMGLRTLVITAGVGV